MWVIFEIANENPKKLDLGTELWRILHTYELYQAYSEKENDNNTTTHAQHTISQELQTL